MRTTFFTTFIIMLFGNMIYLNYHTPSNYLNRIPIEGESEEESDAKHEWERMRLADPLTGEIPEGIAYKELAFVKDLYDAANVANKNNGEWSSRGPWNVGGRTRGLAIDVLNENHILAGGVSGGVWQSKDGGMLWDRVTPYNAHPGCVSIAQDIRQGHTDTWYYLSGEIYGTSASGGNAFYLGDGLFKSTDNGFTWTPVASTAGGQQQSFSSLKQSGWRVVTNPIAINDEVLIATMGAIYRSTNGGNT